MFTVNILDLFFFNSKMVFTYTETMLWILLTLSSFFILGLANSQPELWKSLAFHLDVKFTTKIVFDDIASHVRICASKCSTSSLCESFTYSSQDESCTGYNDVYLNTLVDANLHEAGRKYYTPNDGYTLDKDTMMYFKSTPYLRSGTDAEQNCKGQGYELVHLDSALKLQNIWKLSLSNIYGYGGGAALFVSGNFDAGVWRFWNNASIPDEVWYNGIQPDGSGNNHCVYLKHDGLRATDCDSTMMHYICEKT